MTTPLILTHHARSRIKQRVCSEEEVQSTVAHPTQVKKSKTGSMEYMRKFDGYTVTVIVKRNAHNEDVVLSVWREPPLEQKNILTRLFYFLFTRRR